MKIDCIVNVPENSILSDVKCWKKDKKQGELSLINHRNLPFEKYRASIRKVVDDF